MVQNRVLGTRRRRLPVDLRILWDLRIVEHLAGLKGGLEMLWRWSNEVLHRYSDGH